MDKGNTTIKKICAQIVLKRKMIFIIFAIMGIFCAFSRNWVKVNDELTKYLSKDTETRIAIDLMENEFIEYATADIMVENVTYATALELSEAIEKIDGVKEVAFNDKKDHFVTAEALFSVTFDGDLDDAVSKEGLQRVEDYLAVYDTYINTEIGNPLKTIINKEMLIVDMIAVIIIILVLLFTSKTYGEIPVLLITFGAAALLNMGTNFLMGEISFVTNSIAIVLQLALAIDYAIILCHRYMEEHENAGPEEAATIALSKAIPEISASSLTTVSGLLALCFMQYKLGPDIGMVMIKAILLSLLSVFLLMPGLLVTFADLIDHTHHKNFVPKITVIGRYAFKTRYIVPPIFCLVLALAFFCSQKANYVYNQYSIDSIRKNEMQLAKQKIEDTFGKKNLVAVIIPYGDFEAEKALIDDIRRMPEVTDITGLSDIEAMEGYMLTDSLVAREFAEIADMDVEAARVIYTGYAAEKDEYEKAITNIDGYSAPLIDVFDYLLDMKDEMDLSLPKETEDKLDELKNKLDDGKAQLMSDNWARIVLYLDMPIESEESFECLDNLHTMASRYYDTFYVAGETTSCIDLKHSFEMDNKLISILTIVFVIAVLIMTFKSVGLPLLLILIIQGSILMNFSQPFLMGKNLFFLTYLIISAIQMGANIDYAIVISSRYMELKKVYPLKEAMIQSLNFAFPTIITSGTMLASAGFAIGLIASNETISAIGIYIGTGTAISIFLVMLVLPQILLFGDAMIQKTTFEIHTQERTTKKVGAMRIDGRIKGTLNGTIDAEVHGVFRGDLNAIIDMASVEDLEVTETESTPSVENVLANDKETPVENGASAGKEEEV